MGLPLLCRSPATVGSRAYRRRLPAALVLALAAAALRAPAASASEPDPVALLWNAPVGCSSAEAVQEQVEKSLSGSERELVPVAAVVDVAPGSPGRWRAKLTLHSRGERTERQFEAESCDGLSAAAALIVALAAEGPAGAPAEVAGAQQPILRPDGQVLTMTSAARIPGWSRLGLVTQVNLALDNGTLPRNSEPGLEVSVGGIWTSELWRLRLLGRAGYFLPQDNFAAPGYESLGRYWLLSVSVRECLTVALLRFEFGPCLGGEAIAMHGSSIGGGAASSTQYWLAPVGAVLAAFAISPGLVVFAQGEISVPGTRRTFMGDATPGFFNPVYTVGSLAVRAAAGFELHFF